MKRTKVNAKTQRARLIAIGILGLLLILTGTLYTAGAIIRGDVGGAIMGAIIALTAFVFAILVYKRGNKDLKDGFPIRDERSTRVLEKASSKAFYISIYLLLAIGWLSDGYIRFRDVSQASGLAIGIMALLFLGLWLYYNKREI